MKFLTYFFERSDLEAHERLFREKGIPIHVENTRGQTSFTPFNKWAVHVWIDSQHMDAARLLEDPTHTPENPVDVDEFFDSARDAEANLSQLFSPGLLVAIVAAALLVVIIAVRSSAG